MTDCEDLYKARIKGYIEGDYTTWALQSYCPLDLHTSYSISAPYPQWTEGTTNKVWLWRTGNTAVEVDLDTGAISDTGFLSQDFYPQANSVLGKYVLLYKTSTHKLHIFKDGVDTYQITLPDTGSNNYNYISPSGKWIISKNVSGDILVYKAS